MSAYDPNYPNQYNDQNYQQSGDSQGYDQHYDDNYDNYDDYNDYDNYGGGDQQQKSIKGLKVMIMVLAVILLGLSAMYFLQVRQIRADYAVERDTLTNRLTSLMVQYDTLQTENDTLSQHLLDERTKADSLLTVLKSERNLSYRKIKDYEKRLGYMRDVMEGYIHQIDSLNTINRKLVTENTSYRKQITSTRLRAELAEEKAAELDTKIQKGAVIRARDIALLALTKSDREVTRASRAERLRVDFVLAGNELATPGVRNVYAQIIGPDGYVMANADNALFNFEGDMITYSATREVDFQNEDLNVSLFYNGSGITAGNYSVRVYLDGHMIGTNEIILR